MNFSFWPKFQLLLLPLSLFSADWHQASGPTGNFSAKEDGPLEWSVSRDQNIAWKLTLPETGQSTPVISNGRIFFSTMKPVREDSSLGKDIIAWCCDSETGKVIWKREIFGQFPLRLSGCFSDSSAPPAVCDGERIVFLNASGRITCFDLKGKVLWSQPFLSVGRTLPFLHEGKYIYTRQIYPPEPSGNFPHKYANSPKEMWTQLQSLDISTGKVGWTSKCGVNMGMSTLPQKRNDGRMVAIVGRGGGHGPPEKPFGISMVDLSDGKTLWTLPIDGFMATMTYRLAGGQAHVFHATEHLSVDEVSGKVVRRISLLEKVSVCRMINGERITKIENHSSENHSSLLKDLNKKKRAITQGSNLLVGTYHYFRCYVRPWLGRVNLSNGRVEYLELPLQVSRTKEKDNYKWFVLPGKKKAPGLTAQGIAPNDMLNSRGYKVVGDKRSHGSGWGHVASPVPSVAGNRLYVPIMNGTVFVIDAQADTLDEKAILAVNDLGVAGGSFTRSSLSFSNGNAFAHTIKELICIRK
jgi:outer membrane protein assembly factor BamB